MTLVRSTTGCVHVFYGNNRALCGRAISPDWTYPKPEEMLFDGICQRCSEADRGRRRRPSPVLRLPENTAGRDIIVGDVHGETAWLEALLARLSYDRHKDRLFLLGDLVDRGPDSLGALSWLDRPNVHAVLGNHEELMLDAIQALEYHDDSMETKVLYWSQVGGQWFLDLLRKNDTAGLESVFGRGERLGQLPYAIEIPRGGQRIGLVHADAPAHWEDFVDALAHQNLVAMDYAVWGRQSFRRWKKGRDVTAVEGLDLLVCGHSIVPAPVRVANRLLIDTGACARDRVDHAALTALVVDDDAITLVSMDADRQVQSQMVKCA